MVQRLQRLMLAGESAALLVGIMFVGSLALWVAMPICLLWIGSRVQAATGSLGLAMLAMMTGMLGAIAVLGAFLTWLNRRHVEVVAARGRDLAGETALERVLVTSAVVALVAFAVWFFGFSGSAPLPLQITAN